MKKITQYKFLLRILTISAHVIVLAIILPGCKKSIEIDPPIDRIITDQVFESNATANSAVAGLYSQMMSTPYSFYSGYIEIYSGLSADEWDNTTSYNLEDDFRNNAIKSDNTIIQTNFWAQPYFYIYTCNALIEGLEKSTSLTDSARNQLLGEAKFNRALNYFYLTNFFGDVPLVLTTDSKVSSKIARTASSTVIDQIITDLKDAQSLLTPVYYGTDKARPNKWAATALLARVYLYKQNWSGAEAEAGAVINAGMYELVDVDNTFLTDGNTESLWTLFSSNTYFNTSFYPMYFVPAYNGMIPTYTISPSLLSSFETGDKRKASWIGTTTIDVNGVPTDFNYLNKYKDIGGSTSVTEAPMPLRLAEQYLIRAEARAHLNKLLEAKDDLSAVRQRAGLTTITFSDQSSILSAIEHERQVELFGEWGHRWFDLKRNGDATTVLAPIKGPSWQGTDIYYPIPVAEILKFKGLSQNDGYK
ncbi:RagB/SusD family nutrient uptake outer membrane protein [Niastella sp. OAS944]|uniref:RagB/SusD family nutrient uptake outer membrane protein n=1 Tax=Niastella sp. OAS944 TaxID=2664089 RepID=UPI003494692C|nr:hypothetical protein [Chitinophagaceae bacterium OAS944]